MAEIYVRCMVLEDIPAVEAMEAELFSDAWSKRSLENTIYYRPDTSFVAELDGEIAGYMFFMAAADEGELLRIGVKPECRRGGIGVKLMNHMDEYVSENGIYSVWLEVREHNIPAQELYKKCGFEMQGYRKHYYRNPDEDAVIMYRNYH